MASKSTCSPHDWQIPRGKWLRCRRCGKLLPLRKLNPHIVKSIVRSQKAKGEEWYERFKAAVERANPSADLFKWHEEVPEGDVADFWESSTRDE